MDAVAGLHLLGVRAVGREEAQGIAVAGVIFQGFGAGEHLGPHAAPFLDGFGLQAQQPVLVLLVQPLVGIEEGRAFTHHDAVERAPVLEAHVRDDAAVLVLAFLVHGKEPDLLAAGQTGEQFPRFAGVELGLALAGLELRRVDAGQAHAAAVGQLHGVAVQTGGHRGLAPDGDLFQMGQGVRLCAARAGEGPGHEHAAQEKDQAEATQHD